MRRFASSVLIALASISPAYASGSTPLPEPSGLLLLGLGVAGVVIGRRFARKRGGD